MSVHSVNHRLRERVVTGKTPSWLDRHPRRAYILQLALATPRWANMAEIRRLDRRARELSRSTGKPHVVDHVIPITNRIVCGLNTPANLRVVLKAVNDRKGNRWCEWHGELFPHPEQFTLSL